MIKRFVSKRGGPAVHCKEWVSDSKRRRNEATLWRRRFWEHAIRDDRDYQHHTDYLHFNPVKHGHVQAVQDWAFSTFHRYVRDGVYPEDWGGLGDGQEDGGFGEPV